MSRIFRRRCPTLLQRFFQNGPPLTTHSTIFNLHAQAAQALNIGSRCPCVVVPKIQVRLFALRRVVQILLFHPWKEPESQAGSEVLRNRGIALMIMLKNGGNVVNPTRNHRQVIIPSRGVPGW